MQSPITGSLDGLSFGTGPDTDGFSLVVNRWNGWYDSPPASPDITPRPDANGSYRGRNLRRAKRLTLECTAKSDVADSRELLMDKIVSILADPDTTYPLTRNDITRSLTMWVELDGSVVPVPLGNQHIKFAIPLVAKDPYKYTDYNSAAETGLPVPATDGVQWSGSGGITGLEWDGPGPAVTGLVYQSSTGASGVVRVFNSGTADAPVELTVSATAVNPKMIVVQTGEILRWGGTVSGASVLSINTKTGRVSLDGADAAGLMTNSNFFKIPRQSFIDIAFSGDPGSAGAILTVRNSNVFN